MKINGIVKCGENCFIRGLTLDGSNADLDTTVLEIDNIIITTPEYLLEHLNMVMEWAKQRVKEKEQIEK